jgi:hypothetical protein
MDFNQILLCFPHRSESLTKYNESFLAAKKVFGNIYPEKNGEVQRRKYKYEYAKIDEIYQAVEEALHKNSLYITHQVIAIEVDRELLITTIMHVSGEFIRDIRWNVSEKAGNQGKGSANTYCRKYAILCLCGLSTTDDDGQEEQKFLSQLVTPQQAEEIKALCLNAEGIDESAILKKWNIKNFYYLNNEQYLKLKKHLEKK